VQLAIQGGGAKIFALLAAMEVIQEFEEKKELVVTRIAGTSAGSIVAAMHAAGIKASDIRHRLADRGVRGRLASLFPRLSWPKAAGLVLFGRPFWNERKIRGLLARELAHAGVSKQTVGGLYRHKGVALIFIAADLTNASAVVYDNSDHPVVDAVLDSCAVPFYLRLHSKDRVLVDGGICENFPSEYLEGKEAEFGPIMGLGFTEPTRSSPSKLSSFALALVETAMTHSMARARRRLPAWAMHEIQTTIGTFDFQSGLSTGMGSDHYGRVVSETREFLRNYLAHVRRSPAFQPPPGSDDGRRIMERAHRIYVTQHAPIRFPYDFAAVEIQANTLCIPGEQPWYGGPDLFSHRLVFRPGSQPIYCHSLAIAPTVGGTSGTIDWVEPRRWSLFDAAGSSIEVIDIQVMDPQSPSDLRVVLFFIPALTSGGPLTPPFTLRFQDHGPSLVPDLLSKGRDILGLHFQRAEGLIPKAHIVLHVPRRLATVFLQQQSGESVAPGRPMTEAELDPYPTPVGFRSLGWCGENIAADKTLAVDVINPDWRP
jgi:predicted acylesterase/phospholipase RssA